MADWDPADLKRRFLDAAGIENASELDDDVDIYPLLADGQEEVFRLIAARFPPGLYSAPEAMVASDDRKTFKYAQVNGQDVMMMGWVQISPRLSSFVGDEFFAGWREGIDYMDEGTRIRIPGGRTFSGTLYARGIPRPPRITSSQGPSIRPIEATVLTINRAARKWAVQGNQRPDIAQVMDMEWGAPLTNVPGMFAEWMLTFKRRHRGGGRIYDPAQWYLANPDLGGT